MTEIHCVNRINRTRNYFIDLYARFLKWQFAHNIGNLLFFFNIYNYLPSILNSPKLTTVKARTRIRSQARRRIYEPR